MKKYFSPKLLFAYPFVLSLMQKCKTESKMHTNYCTTCNAIVRSVEYPNTGSHPPLSLLMFNSLCVGAS